MSQPSYDLPSTLPQGLYEQAKGSVNPIDLRGETTSFPAPKVQNPFSAHIKKQSTAFQRPHSLSSIPKHRPSSTYDTSIASSTYPWHRNNVDEFQFLHTSNVFSVADLGISREIYGECTEYIMEDLLVLTSRERATIFNLRTKGIREFKLFQDMLFPAIPDERSACIVSPDGSIIVHRSPSGNITSYRLKDKTFQSSLPPNHKNIQEEDLLNAYWPTSNTVYIPVQSGDCIIRWAFSNDSQTEAIRSLHPMRAVTRHQQLDIFVTSNEQWWIAMGTTWETSGPGVESGMIEIHDVVNEESRLFPGKACCIVETLVYDKPSALLVRADGTMSGKISLSVHSISSSEPEGEQFQPVDILVDVRHPKDSPIRIFSLGSLPIVCLITAFRAIYFFELHIGSLLYCIEAPDHGIDLYPVRFQGRRVQSPFEPAYQEQRM
ncbi:hypothetical protein FRC02_000772 [Tulasnella sp. 418]|nr:hypothetical protein FRC02_000772 [Tulasnella sp. 418]